MVSLRPSQPSLSSALGRPLECHGLLLLRWFVRAGLTALLGIPLPRRLILLVRLLVMALPLVLFRLVDSNRDICHRIIFQFQSENITRQTVELAIMSKNTIERTDDIFQLYRRLT